MFTYTSIATVVYVNMYIPKMFPTLYASREFAFACLAS